MRVVLDTNILLSSISRKSNSRWLFDEILSGNISLIISNDILLEYFEVITFKTNSVIAENIINSIKNLKNTEFTSIYYYWNLITNDADDNKFSDTAVSGNADYLITNDKHFIYLKRLISLKLI
jgi:uncharacterized protein